MISRKMFGLHGLVNPGHQPNLKTTGGLLYYHYDGVHNITETTDRHGQWIERYRYDAFGGIFTGITAPYNTLAFTSQTYDGKAGLVNMNARWYNPGNARFMQEDTWPGVLSTPWTQNRSINMWDPTGNVPEHLTGSIGNQFIYYPSPIFGSGDVVRGSKEEYWSLIEEIDPNIVSQVEVERYDKGRGYEILYYNTGTRNYTYDYWYNDTYIDDGPDYTSPVSQVTLKRKTIILV